MSPAEKLLEEITGPGPVIPGGTPALDALLGFFREEDEKCGGIRFIPATTIPYSAGWYYTVEDLEVGPYDSEAEAHFAFTADINRHTMAEALGDL